MISRIPIRYSIPLLLAALALALTAIAGLHDAVVSLRGWEDLMRRRAAALGNIIVPRLERSLAQNSVADATEEIVALGVIPDLLLALLVGPDDQIIAATEFEFRSRSLHATHSAGALPLVASARATMSTQMEISPDGHVLRAAFPFRLPPLPGELRASRIALLYTESDLATQRRLDLAKILRRSLFMGLMTGVACAIVWAYFHFRFARRVARLVERADALAQGKPASLSPFEGVDELAQISTAINRMAVGLQEHEAHTSAIFAHALDCIIMIDHEGRILDFNPAAERTFGHARERVLGRPLAEVIIPPALRAAHEGGFAHHLATGESRVLGRRIEVSALRADGTEFPVELAITRLPGESARFVGFLRDITERKHADLRLAAHRDLLAGVATGQSLAVSLDAICRVVESQAPGMLCSVLVLDADGAHLRHGAAPSLPAAYCAALDGVAIGPAVGSCGTAAFRGEAVTVSDIATDPLWENYKALALAHGLRACWSTPILGSGGAVLGTFAMYYPTVREPEPEHRQLIALATQTAALAFQREHADAALRESEARWKFAIEGSGDGMWDMDIPGATVHRSARWKEILGYSVEEIGTGLHEWSNRVHPDDLVEAIATAQRHLDGQSASAVLEYRFRCKDGSYKWILERGLVVSRDAAGKALRMVGTQTDTTERKQGEEKLHEQLAELQRWQRVTQGREERVQALKREVNELLRRGGEPERYGSVSS